MIIHIFVLGLPGCGKSSVSRYMATYIEQKYSIWSKIRINDYDILKAMFVADIHNKQFQPTQNEGFDITDFSVLDSALQTVEKDIQRLQHSVTQRELFIIEFSRNDYVHALKNFTAQFLQGSYFLFLNADLNTCRERIRNRVADPKSSDDHFVSEYIFEYYYAKDEKHYDPSIFNTEFGIKEKNIKVLANGGQFESIKDEINRFVDFVIKQESYAASK